jgi:hypothetical protein
MSTRHSQRDSKSTCNSLSSARALALSLSLSLSVLGSHAAETGPAEKEAQVQEKEQRKEVVSVGAAHTALVAAGGGDTGQVLNSIGLLVQKCKY